MVGMKKKTLPKCSASVLNPTQTTQKGFRALKIAAFHTLLLPLAAASIFLGFSTVQQLTDEKTCMQFSIRRPKLPSSETHPEENTHKRLDVSGWLRHLNHSGRVEEEYKLQKVRALPAHVHPSLLPSEPPGGAAGLRFRAGGKNWAFESVKTGVERSAGGVAGAAGASAALEHLPVRLLLPGNPGVRC